MNPYPGAANQSARNWQNFNGCIKKLYEGLLPATWQISHLTNMITVLLTEVALLVTSI
jgi:hypothetical protein